MLKALKYLLLSILAYLINCVIGQLLLHLISLTSLAPLGYGCGAIGKGIGVMIVFLAINIPLAIYSCFTLNAFIKNRKNIALYRYALPVALSLIYSVQLRTVLRVSWFFVLPAMAIYFILSQNHYIVALILWRKRHAAT